MFRHLDMHMFNLKVIFLVIFTMVTHFKLWSQRVDEKVDEKKNKPT